MKKENLLINCNIKAIKERLKTTLGNMQYQYKNMCSMPDENDIVQGYMFWDDMEKIEHCIYALEILEKENKLLTNKIKTLCNILK